MSPSRPPISYSRFGSPIPHALRRLERVDTRPYLGATPPISFPLNPRSRLAWLSRHLISRCARSILGPVPGHCPMVDLAECCARDCHSLRQSPFEAPDRSRRVLPSIDINLELSAHSRSYLGAILTLAIEPD
ncbi:hypothetical protein NMY22_g4642 [Coprinellus aureogranulatus]|nr:hypothetical protein NMY22_g4642 [Coprinellus aureogranulatus]